MIKKYNNISLALGIPGLIMQVGGMVAGSVDNPAPFWIANFGSLLLIAGFAFYAKAKGRSPVWCVMAFFSLIGLLVLACLTDYSEEQS